MFFTMSKVFFFVSQPSSLIVILLVVGLVAAALGFPRIGRTTGGAGLALLLVLTLTPLGPWLLGRLEDRFPQPPADAATPAGIVLLGGFTNDGQAVRRGIVGLSDGAEGLFEVAAMAKRWPDVPIVLSGGSNSLLGRSETSEAEWMKRLLGDLGVAPERMILEDGSRTTWENAAFTHERVHPVPGANWWLVTTASHMPRAIGAFRAAGWSGIVARPSSYRTSGRIGLRPPLLWGLITFDAAVKEIIGLAAYRATGRSSDVFPEP